MKHLRLLAAGIFLLTLYFTYVKHRYPFDWPNFLWGTCTGLWIAEWLQELATWSARRKKNR